LESLEPRTLCYAYIILLWPSARDSEPIELFRRDICQGCDPETILARPVHLTLFYGFETDDIEPVAAGLRALARQTPPLQLDLSGVGTFGENTVYLKVVAGPRILELQARVAEIVRAARARVPGHPARRREIPVPPSAGEIENVRQWGSYYPYSPHITLARRLAPGEIDGMLREAEKAFAGLPDRILADRMSLAQIEAGFTMSETVEYFGLVAEDDTMQTAQSPEKRHLDVRDRADASSYGRAPREESSAG